MEQKISNLDQKVRKLTEKTAYLALENEKLKEELSYFEKDKQDLKKSKVEYDGFVDQKNQIKEKLSKLLNKFTDAGI
ncbi:MAG: hypothetical protein A2252_03595 [Elusimicrobia bacterium RIFOXYA2_FULL_39_19]|nr:MAG: hypothetical protein A2252_03595 [Elusimicrobia bacterium RIFOXYA2_FULL_39_19]